MNKRLWRHSFAAAAVAFFLAFTSGGVAHADTSKDGITDTWTAAKGQLKKQDVFSGSTTQTMRITGFDEKVAEDNGYEIIKDANGKAVGSKKKGEISTNAVIIWGPCGESHVLHRHWRWMDDGNHWIHALQHTSIHGLDGGRSR